MQKTTLAGIRSRVFHTCKECFADETLLSSFVGLVMCQPRIEKGYLNDQRQVRMTSIGIGTCLSVAPGCFVTRQPESYSAYGTAYFTARFNNTRPLIFIDSVAR